LNQPRPLPQPRRVSFPDSSSYPADTSGETETEPELPELPPNTDEIARKVRSDSNYSTVSIGSTTPKEDVFLPAGRKRSKTVSMHDLTNRFFRKPVIVLSKIDIFRSAAEFQEKTKADN
jgi:phosphatidylethanolamine N-methyltransferase